jgi:hypothetical protein
MNPEMHMPCPVCGAVVLAGIQRCRYCGELLAEQREPAAAAPDEMPRQLGTEHHALLVAIGTLALPVHAALSGLTPPYSVPMEAMAIGPHATAAVVLGAILGLVWLPRFSRSMAPVLAFVLNGLAFVQMASWRAMVLPIDPDLLPLGCMIGLVAALGAWAGRGLAWFTRRSLDDVVEATTMPEM